MKTLNIYISEKFKINKDTKISHINFKKGDPIMRIAIFSYKGRTIDELIINSVNRDMIYYFYGVSLGERINFTYSPDDNSVDGYGYEDNIDINSNGYCEFYGKSSEWEVRSIYLNKENAIEFINDIALDFYKQKNKINKYFDKSDSFNSLTIKNTQENLKELLKLYKKS